MTGTLQRTQVLLEEQQQRTLAQMARNEGKSLSALLREIVQSYIEERLKEADKKQALEALEYLAEMRKAIEQRSGVHPGDLVAEVRAEREAQIDRVLFGEKSCDA
ncbi:MAG: ribbon-helix-helix protein, CopG family [Anaerolineae bacterium]